MLWHMHQPHYEDAASGEFALPWVRLHSAKDYVDMVERVAEHPGLKLTGHGIRPEEGSAMDAMRQGVKLWRGTR